MMSVELSHSVTEGDRQGAPENLVSQVVSVRAAVDGRGRGRGRVVVLSVCEWSSSELFVSLSLHLSSCSVLEHGVRSRSKTRLFSEDMKGRGRPWFSFIRKNQSFSN